MLRAVLLGAMSFAAIVACGSKTDAPAAQPGAVAGKVLEVTGSVKTGTVALVVGSTVKTDDVIETGADGTVVIELAHNQARWELGPNNKKKPTESLAWTAAKARGSAVATSEQTSAAGRPAERSAADTSSGAKTSGSTTGAPGGPAETPTAQPAAHNGPPTRVTAPEPSAGQASQKEEGGASHSQTTPPAPTVPSAKNKRMDDASDRGVPIETPTSTDPLQSLASCLPAGTTITLNVHVANHKPAVSFVGAVDSKVQACITTAAKKLSLAVESGDLQVSLTK